MGAVECSSGPVRLLQRDHDGVVPQDVRLVLPLGVVEDLPREVDAHLAHPRVHARLLQLLLERGDHLAMDLEVRRNHGGRVLEGRGRRGGFIGPAARRRRGVLRGVPPGHGRAALTRAVWFCSRNVVRILYDCYPTWGITHNRGRVEAWTARE